MKAHARVLVTGAGGFIGHHLVKYLVNRGCWVRGVDIKRPEYEATAAAEFRLLDLRCMDNCLAATEGVDEVYALAANMGGIGFIENNTVHLNPCRWARILASIGRLSSQRYSHSPQTRAICFPLPGPSPGS